MRASPRKRAKDSWTFVLELGRDPATGKRRQKSVTVKGTKRDAERVQTRMLNEMEMGTFVEPSKVTLAAFLRRWLDTYVDVNLRALTAMHYRNLIETHLIPNLGQVELGRLNAAHVQEYYARALKEGRADGKGGLSAQTVKHHHRILAEALNYAVKWNLIARNVADLVTAPTPRKYEPRILTFDEARELLEAFRDSWLYLIVHLALYAGLRRSETLGLRWRDVALDRGYLAVAQTLQEVNGAGLVFEDAKTKLSASSVVLAIETVEELRGYKAAKQGRGESTGRDSLVFTRDGGRPVLPSTVSKSFRRRARRLGFHDLPFKDLRHTHGSLMLEAGANLKQGAGAVEAFEH